MADTAIGWVFTLKNFGDRPGRLSVVSNDRIVYQDGVANRSPKPDIGPLGPTIVMSGQEITLSGNLTSVPGGIPIVDMVRTNRVVLEIFIKVTYEMPGAVLGDWWPTRYYYWAVTRYVTTPRPDMAVVTSGAN